jgi:hypothetical protein
VVLYSKIGDTLINKYIPAVTSVAACNKALTGVGYLTINFSIDRTISSTAPPPLGGGGGGVFSRVVYEEPVNYNLYS